MIRAEANVGDFLKSFLNMGDLQDNLDAANISSMQETSDPHWGTGMYGLICNAKIFIN